MTKKYAQMNGNDYVEQKTKEGVVWKQKSLIKTLDDEDRRDERTTLAIILLILGFCNTSIIVMAPAYVIYRRMMDYYPFVSRFELHSWLLPISVLAVIFGMMAFTVSVMLYVKFHNAINGRLNSVDKFD